MQRLSLSDKLQLKIDEIYQELAKSGQIPTMESLKDELQAKREYARLPQAELQKAVKDYYSLHFPKPKQTEGKRKEKQDLSELDEQKSYSAYKKLHTDQNEQKSLQETSMEILSRAASLDELG